MIDGRNHGRVCLLSPAAATAAADGSGLNKGCHALAGCGQTELNGGPDDKVCKQMQQVVSRAVQRVSKLIGRTLKDFK